MILLLYCALFLSIQNNYHYNYTYNFQTVILHLINLYNYIVSVFLYCGGHHDSDRTAVLVWSPRLKLLYSKYHQFMYTLPNKDFLPSFLPTSYCVCAGGMLAVTHLLNRGRTKATQHSEVNSDEFAGKIVID